MLHYVSIYAYDNVTISMNLYLCMHVWLSFSDVVCLLCTIGAIGVKIVAPEIGRAVAGTPVLVVQAEDDVEVPLVTSLDVTI